MNRGGVLKRQKRVNPETLITGQIRELMDLMRIPHFKHWGGPFGSTGIPDIIGTLPGGRALWIEVKVPGRTLTPEQSTFLERHRAAGAVAFMATGPRDLLLQLSEAGFEPAKRLKLQFSGRAT